MAINLQVAVRLHDLFSRPLANIQSATRSATTALNNFNATSSNVKGASLDGMTNSIARMREAINSLEEKKRQLSLWDNTGIAKCNSEISRLKESMAKAKKAQGEVNVAMKNGNADKIRQSYSVFNSEVKKTESIVKKNTTEQNKFNNSIAKGNNEAKKGNSIFGGLGGKIAALAGTYAGLKSVGSALNLSDTMTQTTARLDMMNDGLQTTDELQQKIFSAAQRSRGSYQASADAISKMGIMAGDAFKTNDELIGFVEQLNKQFTIAGTSQEGISAAMLQLTQAMGSGVLRGEELNSVFEQAPTIIQSIAGYLKVPIGEIRDMAKEGKLSASVVKNALLSSADETNKKFESMPMTFGQIATSIKNQALMAFQPVLKNINKIANSESFQGFVDKAIKGISGLSNIVTQVGASLINVASVIKDNWNKIAPVFENIYQKINSTGIITDINAIKSAFIGLADTFLNSGISSAFEIIGVSVNFLLDKFINVWTYVRDNWSKIASILTPIAVTIGVVALAIGIYNLGMLAASTATKIAAAAQAIFNAALWSCPLTWIIVGIIAIIGIVYLAVAAFNKFTGSTVSATGIITGALATVGAFIYNLFLGVLDIVKGVIEYFFNGWIAFANFFSNVFKDPVGSVIRLFGDLGDRVLGIVEKIASAIDKVFGSNLASAVSGFRGNISNLSKTLADKLGNGKYEEKFKKIDINKTLDSAGINLNRKQYGNAFNSGYNFGEGIDNGIKGLSDKLKGLTDEVKGGNKDNSSGLSDIKNSIGGDNNKIDEVGKVGKVGSVKNDVNISDEDLKALREFATKEYMQKISNTTNAPVINIKVAEVKETADINKLIEKFTAVLSESMSISAEGVY